jgi:Protein of unknown function (DUF2470)
MPAGVRWQASPSAAERARTVLVAASGAAVTSLASRPVSLPVWLSEQEGRLLLRPVTEQDLPPAGAAAAACPRAVVEVADVAPVPLRDRIRARVRLTATLVRDETDAAQPTWHCLPERVFLDEGGLTRRVPLADLRHARPDPFALVEGALLGHLDAAHDDEVQTLARLLEPGLNRGALRLRPVRLDHRGLVLRVEYAERSRDVRLAFPAAVSTPEQMSRALRALLTRARDRPGDRPATRRG